MTGLQRAATYPALGNPLIEPAPSPINGYYIWNDGINNHQYTPSGVPPDPPPGGWNEGGEGGEGNGGCTTSPPDAPNLYKSDNNATGITPYAGETYVWLIFYPIGYSRWGENCDGNNHKHYYFYKSQNHNSVLNASPTNTVLTPACNLNAYGLNHYSCPITTSPAQTYYWKVVTWNGSEAGSSSIWRFSTSYLGTIQGSKVLMPGNQVQNPSSLIGSQPVTVETSEKTDNPYTFYVYVIPNSSFTVSVPTLADYNIGYTLCYNDTTCHNNTPTSGNSVSVSNNSIGNNGYADLRWHYTPKTYTATGSLKGLGEAL